MVSLPELWTQPSFPEFVDWLIRWTPALSSPLLFVPETELGETPALPPGLQRMPGCPSTQVTLRSDPSPCNPLLSLPCLPSTLQGPQTGLSKVSWYAVVCLHIIAMAIIYIFVLKSFPSNGPATNYILQARLGPLDHCFIL